MIQTELCEKCKSRPPILGLGVCTSCWEKFVANKSEEKKNGLDTEKSDREESSGSTK